VPRPRTGSLTLRTRGGVPTWHAQVTATVDGRTRRLFFELGTGDRLAAKRKLARLVADLEAGKRPAVAAEMARQPQTVAAYAEAWLERRTALGIGMVRDERCSLVNDVLPLLGELDVGAVRPVHVRAVLDRAVERALARNTISHLRALLHRFFKQAWQDELIPENPVARVPMPRVREVRRDRSILTDAEFVRYLACTDVDPEIQTMALVARVEGGMRTSDVTRWAWTMVDLEGFASCTIPRSKTGKPQAIEIPAVVAERLCAWWESSGRPRTGPVFPVRRGERAGDFRPTRGVSFAERLRRDLLRAGVKRHACTRLEDAPPVRLGEACCSAMAHDPLFAELPTSRPVDFHSFRRAFCSALAEAGVNVQQAMRLASHSDPKVHARYVMGTEAMRRIPPAALPPLSANRAASSATARCDSPEIWSHLRDLNSRPTVYETVALPLS